MVKKYNEIEVKDNMKVDVDNNGEEILVETKDEKRQLERVVTTQPKKIKRSLFGRLITGIVGPEGLPSIGTYVNEEIIKPAVKNIIYDSITSGLGKALNMDYRAPRGGQRGALGHRPTVNYSNRHGNPSRQPEGPRTVRPAKYGVEEYIIEDRYQASDVLIALKESADRYNVVSVADYYDLIGVPTQYTDNNFGWTMDSIVHATIVPTRGGYIIRFPQVEAI